MRSRSWSWTALLTASAAQLLPGVAVAQTARPADSTCWIALRGGAVLAARCPYEQRGDRLRFRGIDGVLVALPLEWVDLEATAAARRRPSPRAARLVTVESRSPAPAAAAVGRAGEAAKRAGRKGAFVDLSRLVVVPPEPAPPTPATARGGDEAAGDGSRTARPRGGAPPAAAPATAGWWAVPLARPDPTPERDRLRRLRLKRVKPPG